MATQIGKAQIFGLDGALIASGYATIIQQSVRITASSQSKDRIVGQTGEIEAVIYSQKILELSVDFIPSGASTTAAKATATIPTDGGQLTLSGFPVVSLLGIADALNSALWVVEGGTLNGEAGGKWTMTLNLARYPSITNTTALT